MNLGDRLPKTASDRVWRTMAAIGLDDAPDGNHRAAERVARVAEALAMTSPELDKVRAVVLHAIMNARRRANFRCVFLKIHAQEKRPATTVTGPRFGKWAPESGRPRQGRMPSAAEGEVSGRSWGFFVLGRQADFSPDSTEEAGYLIELFLYPEEGEVADASGEGENAAPSDDDSGCQAPTETG